jgi:AraC-like DNA-binding protein
MTATRARPAARRERAGATAERPWIPAVAVPAQEESAHHVLLWQVRGAADVVVAGVERMLGAGNAMWVPVGTPHEFTVHADSVTMPLFFEAGGLATTLDRPTVVPVDRDLRTLMLGYSVTLYTIVRPEADLARQILARVERGPVAETGPPMPATPSARAIADALRCNPGDARSVGELAESVHASPRTIERAFSTETGMTLRRWRLRTRMEAAAVLLRADAATDAAAHRVGYTNVNAFRRAFLEHFGATPTVYRARYRAQ